MTTRKDLYRVLFYVAVIGVILNIKLGEGFLISLLGAMGVILVVGLLFVVLKKRRDQDMDNLHKELQEELQYDAWANRVGETVDSSVEDEVAHLS